MAKGYVCHRLYPPPPCSHVNYFHVQLQPIRPDVFAPLLRTSAEKLRLESLTRGWRMHWSWCRGCWCPARMLRDVPDEAMPELFDVRNCHDVKHALPSPMQSFSDIYFLLGSRKTLLNSTKHHRTPHGSFPNGWCELQYTFQTHELLFPFPVGGSTFIRHRCEIPFLMSACSLTKSIAQQNSGFAMSPLIRAMCKAHVPGSLRRPRNLKPQRL